MRMPNHYHFIGIGGIGMSAVAKLLLTCGWKVSGSDLKRSGMTQELEALGACIFPGHAASNLEGADVVVFSSAVREDNPEMIEAHRRGMRIMRRAEALAGLMRDQTVITVAGSHGKTTTTSLFSCLLIEAGLHPTVAVGGIVRNIGTNACMGKGDYFVAEADESDGSFLCYEPTYSVITNIDYEHMDYYKNFESQLEAFGRFARRTKQAGCVFYCRDDEPLRRLMRGYDGRSMTFGLTDAADVCARNIVMEGLISEFDCHCAGAYLGRFRLSLGGAHNVSNSLAVIAVGLQLGIGSDVIARVLGSFKGVSRRLEIKSAGECATFIDDYAHHPTEIRATLAAVRRFSAGRIIAVFQPHRYSRTKFLMDEFGRCFSDADIVIVTDIYAASELPIEGVTGESVYAAIREYGRGKEASYIPREELVPRILEIIRQGDVVITLGAGDIVRTEEAIIEELRTREKPG